MDLIIYLFVVVILITRFLGIMEKRYLYEAKPTQVIDITEIKESNGTCWFDKLWEEFFQTFQHGKNKDILPKMAANERKRIVFMGIIFVGLIVIYPIVSLYFLEDLCLVQSGPEILRSFIIIRDIMVIVCCTLIYITIGYYLTEMILEALSVIEMAHLLNHASVIYCQDFNVKNGLSSSQMDQLVYGLERLKRKYIKKEKIPIMYVYSTENRYRQIEGIFLSDKAAETFVQIVKKAV